MIKLRKLSQLFGLLALLLLLPGQSFAQNLRVQGRVLDELGEGLIGAGVVPRSRMSRTPCRVISRAFPPSRLPVCRVPTNRSSASAASDP